MFHRDGNEAEETDSTGDEDGDEGKILYSLLFSSLFHLMAIFV